MNRPIRYTDSLDNFADFILATYDSENASSSREIFVKGSSFPKYGDAQGKDLEIVVKLEGRDDFKYKDYVRYSHREIKEGDHKSLVEDTLFYLGKKIIGKYEGFCELDVMVQNDVLKISENSRVRE